MNSTQQETLQSDQSPSGAPDGSETTAPGILHKLVELTLYGFLGWLVFSLVFSDDAVKGATNTTTERVRNDWGLFKDQAEFDDVFKNDRGVVMRVELKHDPVTKRPQQPSRWVMYAVLRDQQHSSWVARSTCRSFLLESPPTEDQIRKFAGSCGLLDEQ